MNIIHDDDLEIPWKHYRREKFKTAREDLPPQPVAPWYRGPNPRFPRPGSVLPMPPPSNIIPLTVLASAKTQQEQDDDDDASLPR
ncbi:hypothetical protein [Haloferula sp. BvORR071]|uniref:hypothetical protein n=1 Tax=Haloferula sp. BvORR071 TaxID=1396141 RepID=UPI000550A583|nr:hypothetical protein [Haloferula sp. BvORR071]